MTLSVLVPPGWWMGFGERAALEGVLSVLQPDLAIEIGTGQGGSLQRIAAHSREVHSFDFAPRVDHVPSHVHLHRGDNHILLPQVLSRFVREGRNVDFVLVDGDHSATGVRRDLEDLLSSDSLRQTVVVLHDTMNEGVRSGIERVRFEDHSKVVYVDLDFVPSYQVRHSPLTETWGGLGLAVIDSRGTYTLDLFRHFRMGMDEDKVVVRGRLSRSSAHSSPARRLARPVRQLARHTRDGLRRMYQSRRRAG